MNRIKQTLIPNLIRFCCVAATRVLPPTQGLLSHMTIRLEAGHKSSGNHTVTTARAKIDQQNSNRSIEAWVLGRPT